MNKGMDSTRMIADTDDTDLQSFFSRPIKIAEYEWSTSLKFFEDFDPWTLFCENPKVINRLANYNLLRANLCVKILINGNGFYYGRLLASYLPLASQDTLTKNRALIDADLVAASQRPHVYLDPSCNQGGELCLPFFFFFDALSIPKAEWNAMGTMNIREMNPLRHANGSTDPIGISVIAWMEDVTLSVPTASNPTGIQPQAGMESQQKSKKKKKRVTVTSNKAKSSPMAADEYGSGPVSGPASTAAKIAGMLSNAPIIGPYAKATQIAMSGVSNVAKLFGYSRAPTLEPIHEYTPRYFNDLVHMNTPDNSTKLSLDSKQELTVDGTVTGLDNTDEMIIKNIVCRESFLDNTTWGLADTSGQVLMSLNVTPDLTRTYSPGVPNDDVDEKHYTALNFGASLFKYWRGSMKFRFQIVASAYHKGRIKVQWDPNGYATQDYNTQFTHIVDISEDKDFTIEIGWGSPFGWLKNRPPWNTPDGYTLRVFNASMDEAFNNGTLTVSVMNTLTSPSATAGDTVELNCFVSAGDDMEFAVPTDENIKQLTPLQPYTAAPARAATTDTPILPRRKPRGDDYAPQSGMEAVQADQDDTTQPSAPVQTEVISSMGATPDDTDYSLDVYHGESIQSFRSVLKRYCYTGLLDMGISTDLIYVKQFLKMSPPLPGYTTNVTWGGGTDCNYVKMTPLAYLSSAFGGQRGGIRWKGFLVNESVSDTCLLAAQVEPETTVLPGTKTTALLDLASVAASPEAYGSFLDPTFSGVALSPLANNPVVEVEIPYQTQGRFISPRYINKVNAVNDKIWSIGGLIKSSADGAGMMMHCSAAEDFSLHFFLGAPVYVYVDG